MTVRKNDERVWIDGTAGFSPATYASSPHGCQARILQVLGEKTSYDDLVCYGGFAFRVGIHEQMCPSAGHPFCGFMCVEGSQRALPWRTRVFESAPWDSPKDDRAAFEEKVCAAVRESIDHGLPVHYGGEEDGLIIGYANEGRRWWCVHPYHKHGEEAFWHDEATGFAGGSWPWGIVVWTEAKPTGERLSDRDLTVAALKQAVEMWSAGKVEAYLTGDAAYAHWLGWLASVENGTVDDPKGGMQGNGWCFDVLIHSRRIAGGWLSRKAGGFAGEAGTRLAAAARHYSSIAAECIRDLDCPWSLAPGPNRFGEWTSDMRRNQISRLESAREYDRAAIDEIGASLQSLE